MGTIDTWVPTYDFTVTGDVPGTLRDGAFMGCSVRETGGTTALNVVLKAKGSGKVMATVHCAIGESKDIWLGPNGLKCQGGVTATVSGGGVCEGSVRFR